MVHTEMQMLLFTTLALLAVSRADPLPAIRVARSSGCDAAYSNIVSDHTMCLTDKGQENPLSDGDVIAIVAKHNNYRDSVTPTATNLFKLKWDADIATVALKLAKQCTLSHDASLARRVPSLPGVYIGQNIGAGHADILAAIDSWHLEVDDFVYGVGNTSMKAIGHYTQVVGYRAVRIGCGEANCPGFPNPRYQVCNYAVGQYTPELKKPYKQGTSCSDCPSGKCQGNLCYCDGKVCLNGGTLDSTTCTCSCPTTHTGDTCQTESDFDCPTSDKGICNMYGSCGGDWMMDNCPIKCGRCPALPNCDKQCTNAAPLKEGCTCECFPDYTGELCETLTCPSNPTHFYCGYVEDDNSYCDYWNFKYTCPSLCGICTP